MIYDLAVVGAGTCGLFAVINSQKLKTIVFDKNSGAKKLAITGNRKSNITNCSDKNSFLDYYGKNGNFLRDAFGLFFKDELVDFLHSEGFRTICKDNRVVIDKNSSSDLAEAMLNTAKRRVTSFKEYEPVVDIKKIDSLFDIVTTKRVYKAKSVLLACGGMSYPKTGSDGSCYKIAKKFGHTIIEPEAYEVPFCSSDTKNLSGLSFKDVVLTLKTDKKRFVETGDMIFTHFGISGPAILKLSEHSFEKARLFVNFMDIGKEELVKALLSSRKKVKNTLKEFMPGRFVDNVIKTDKYVKGLSKKEVSDIINTLFEFKLDVKKCSFDRAFVTKGGVSVREINPKTMESKIVKNLFFCGEIMDIQGSIGGFNLQAAFSTAFCAVSAVNRYII